MAGHILVFMGYCVCVCVCAQYAGFLLHDKRYEAAFSVYQKILQIRRDVGSDWDVDYILCQVCANCKRTAQHVTMCVQG